MVSSSASRHAMATVTPNRVCPECGSSDFHDDPENGEVACQSCGLVVTKRVLPERDLAFEQATHSARNRLHFDKALGTDMDRRTMFTLMANNHVGVRGRENLGLRLRELQKVLSNNGWKHPAQECASELLERFGLKYTSSSSTQESRLSHIMGDSLGGLIDRFYAKMKEDLEQSGYAPFVSIRHREIVENLLALMLGREAYLNNDRRRFDRIIPHLRLADSTSIELLRRHIFASRMTNVKS